MRTLIALVALAACVDTDRTDPTPDAGGDSMVAPMAGAWSAGWACAAPCGGPSPLSEATGATITEVPGRVTVEWYRNGDPAPTARHVGQRGERDLCAAFPDGADGGIARGGYTLCLTETDPPDRLTGVLAWSSAAWTVDMSRR